MRKLVLGILGASALTMASAASATITLDFCSMTCSGPTTLDATTTTIGYEKSGLSSPNFTEWLVFTNSDDGIYSVSLDTSSRSVNFTDAYVTADFVNFYALSLLGSFGANEFWGLDDTLLAAGQYWLVIDGANSGTGSLGGTVTIQEAVPEPATWAMMLLGFGAIGWQLRRRRSQMITQAA